MRSREYHRGQPKGLGSGSLGSRALAEQLLTQTRGEHPALAAAGQREQLLAATWLACWAPQPGHPHRLRPGPDLTGWLDWLARHHLASGLARALHVQMWTRAQFDAGAASASVKRRLAALSSFYAHCV